MASSANPVEGLEAPLTPQPKLPIVPLLIVVILAVLFSVTLLAAGGYFVLKSGRISFPMLSGAASSPRSDAPVQLPTHALNLEPMVVNLADADGKAYLRLSLTLRVEDAELTKGDKSKEEKPKDAKGASGPEAAVRDTALEVLGHQTADKLLAPDGKEHLKGELRKAIAERNPDLKVSGIYFTEFLVQR